MSKVGVSIEDGWPGLDNTMQSSTVKIAQADSVPIRLVTPWYGEFAGGAEFAARRLAENLSMNGVDVEVLTTCCRSPFDDWWSDDYEPGRYELNHVTVRRFPVNTEHASLYHATVAKMINGLAVTADDEMNFMRGSINSHALIAFIKAHRDPVHVFIPYLYGPTFWGVKALGQRSVMIPCLHDEEQAGWGAVRDMVVKAGKLIFLSSEEKRLAERLYKKDFSSMPVLGVGVDPLGDLSAERFRIKYGVEGPFIIYVGRKDRGKNLPMLIDYFNSFRESYRKDITLILVGGGDADLVPSGDPGFRDLGYIPESDKHDAMAASIALVNLSANESFSFVIMEAWLAGRPVIVNSASDVTCAHSKNSHGGLVVSNAEEFCSGLMELAGRNGLADDMGRKGRRYVEDNYLWDGIAAKYIEVINEVA